MQKPSIIAELELKSRRRRFSLFTSLFSNVARSDRPITILDVGGTWDYWGSLDWSVLGNVEIVLLNVFSHDKVPPPFKSEVADGRDLSVYAEGEFDIVHCNSVLGHVGTLEDQKTMAMEIQRVGKAYFVQTPNHRFIVDWRTLVPFFHFLPPASQAWCFRNFSVGTYPRIKDYSKSIYLANRVRNLAYNELKMLFPGGTIVHERVVGLTKSFVVHSGFGSS